MRRPREGQGARRDGGFSLVEMVVSITIMAITIGPLLGAVIAGITSSQTFRNVAQVETAVQNAVDRVNRAPIRCDYSVYVRAAAQAAGWTPANATASYQHWVPGATTAQQGSWTAGACAGSTPTDLLVQLVNVTMTSPQGVSRSIQVVKSDV